MIALEIDNFKIELEFLGVLQGKPVHRYRFWDYEFRSEPLFAGSDYQASPCYEPESLEAVADILGFFSVRRGDTDDAFFDKYTQTQLEWIDNWSERLDLLSSIESDLQELVKFAEKLYEISNDDSIIAWDEWSEAEEPCFPVRLRFFEGKYFLYGGHPDFDQDHRGEWSSGFITEDMTQQECAEEILQMKRELEAFSC